MRVQFHPKAAAELDDAISFYNHREPELGDVFAAAVLDALDAIVKFPEASPNYRRGTRRAVLERFPFGIVYSAVDEGIVVYAVMHFGRHPDYWLNRR